MISTQVHGSGPAVLLLPAGVADRRMWDTQRDVLVAGGYRVVCPDPRGFGTTPAGEAPWDPLADVLEVADALGLDRFALVGASAGGSVALRLAAEVPDRVRALVLLCPAAPDLEPSEELRASWREELRLVDAGDLEGAATAMARTFLGPEADQDATALVVSMQQRAYELQLAPGAAEETQDAGLEDGRVALERITAPTLAVSGAHDLPDFGAVARRVAAGVHRGEHVELSWAGHLPTLERPAEAARLVLDALDRFLAQERLAD